jgi:hypothetical protein
MIRTTIRATIAALATVLTISGWMLGHETGSAAHAGSALSATPSIKPLVVSGRISSDGKSLLTDIDSEWTISNAEFVKGHEGRMVTVKCYVDTRTNRLEVLSIKHENSATNYASRQTDSAFRR